ncbi:MAG: permease-like cell division protein FtsX [Firmicutes bacterium]|nr:permease-like cell division protein FtsX [Bacillota bacterium]
MRISTFFYTLKQGIINIFRNKLFSLASIATISACLFLFGLFFTVILNFQHMIQTAEEGVSVTVFFKEGVTEEEMVAVGDQIRARQEVSEAVFVTADEAWAEWAPENIGEDYEEIYSENPLEGLDNYEIYMKDVAQQETLVTWLESLPQVDSVKRSEMAATTLTGVNMVVAYTSAAIIAILLAVSIFLINNTVMIGISVRKEEIEIMKYIGATDFFVRSPFVIEGILIGLIGSCIPLGVIYLLYMQVMEYVALQFPALSGLMQFLPVSEVYRTLVPVCMGLGAGIGFLGSFATVRKHLRV